MTHAAACEANLLLVDDDLLNIRALARCLPKNYHHQQALSGEEALALLSDNKTLPDMILLDMKMPGMSGLDFCRSIKTNKCLRHIPVIFISGSLETDGKIEALGLGGVDYITKPYNVNEVLAKVDIHLQHGALQRKLQQANAHLESLVFEKVGELFKIQAETIFALTNLVNCRYDCTSAGLIRIQNICKLLAENLGQKSKYQYMVNEAFVSKIYTASPLYEIGNVGVPDAILFKKEELSLSENEVLKSHTIIGSETLAALKVRHPGNGLIEMGIEITLSHHEKWDGSGYPQGLAGNEIPLSAQLVAMAEAYANRVKDYEGKQHLCFKSAKEFIVLSKDTLFNPDLVEAFLEVEYKIRGLFL